MKPAEAWQATTLPPLRTVVLAALSELVPPEAAHEPLAGLLLQARAQLAPAGWTAALHALSGGSRAPAPSDQRLLQLTQGLGLHPIELLAAATALAAQLDPAAARAVAWLQGTGLDSPGAAALPTLGLLAAAGAALMAPDEPADAALLQLLHGPAARAGLWVVGAAEVPSQCSVQLPTLLLPWLHHGLGAPAPADAALAPSQWQVLQAALAPLRAGRAVLLRCASDDEGAACAARVAQALGRPLLPLPAGPWPEGAALLARAGLVLPLLVLAPAGALLSPPAESAVPLLALAGNDGAVSLPGRRLVELRVPLPTVTERAAHWRHLGWPEPEALALRSRCGLSQVQQLHDAAQLHAAARGAPSTKSANSADLLHAQAGAAAAAFEGLGQLIPTAQPPQLVLTAANQQALQQLLARCRVRERLHDHAQHSTRAAVCALFSGPSGTGKTLAASWLAAQLRLPLVAIDLAALTSKWIGETEKNLAQVFSRAEGLGVVLLFDEADALFGARTDTHSSNDRFANQQTNYLLSRIERFDGIAVLTSNARQRLDSAFARRIDALVEFRQPGLEERRALWALHLGTEVPGPWLDRLASLVELPGGHVRAAALYAQALALDAGRALAPADLLAGLQAEHAKLDRSVAPELMRPWQ